MFKIEGEIAKFLQISVYLRNETCSNISYLRQLLRYKKRIYIDNFIKTSSDIQPHFYTVFAMH